MSKKVFIIKTCVYIFACASLAVLILAGCSDEETPPPPELTPGYYQAEYAGTTDKGDAFLVCGTGGRLDKIFEDGTVENIQLPVGEKDLTSMLVGDRITLVGGSSGALVYSRNGNEFQAASGVGKEHIVGLTEFNNRYYACTFSGKILSSTNGTSWGLSQKLSEKPFIGIAAVDTCIMAVTADTDIYMSKNGDNWELSNYNAVYEGLSDLLVFTGIQGLGEIVVLGYPIDTPDGPLVMSTYDDGETWRFTSYRELNHRSSIEEYLPIKVYSVRNYGEELFAACDRGRVLTYTSCPTCDLITTVAGADLRCIAVSDNKTLVAGDGFEYKLLNPGMLSSAYRISADDASNDMMVNGAVLIDVRPTEEYDAWRIPNSVNIPESVLRDTLLELISDKRAELIFYGTDEAEAQAALGTAIQLGYQNVYTLGGISNWPYDFE